MAPVKTTPLSIKTPCDRCGSMRTEQRPLFVGMYTHCFSCDGPKQTLAVKVEVHRTKADPVVTAWVGPVRQPQWTNVKNLGDVSVGDTVYAEGCHNLPTGYVFVYGSNILHKTLVAAKRSTSPSWFVCECAILGEDPKTKPKPTSAGLWISFQVQVYRSIPGGP